MSTETDLNVYPYENDYDETKDFAQILFKPAVSVQTRELNQLQTILQKQVERFGDSVFKSGTIVEGCNFTFIDSYPYVKLLDQEADGTTPTVPSDYVGMFATSNTGLRAFIQDHADGYESAAPDMKTLYLRYLNTGSAGEEQFSRAETLTVTDSKVSLQSVTIENGGLGFSNTDQLVVTPALVVNVSSGSFTNGEYVTQPSLSSNLQVIWIDDTSLALAGQVILGVRPPTAALSAASVNSAVWSVSTGAIRNQTNTVVGTVESLLGTGANGTISTDGTGRVVGVSLSAGGSGYSNVPYVTVSSANNTSGVTALTLTGLNYRAKLRVANTSTSVGNGYAFAVSSGVVYQRGFFLRVPAQSAIVSKYDQTPNSVVAGFLSTEDIVDANLDPSLNDPLTGGNFGAPGADRLRIRTTISVMDKADVDSSTFLPVVEWSGGQPTITNQSSVYSQIGDEMARRTRESAGDYVVDPFLVTTASPSNSALEGTSFEVVVDPGLGYVSGYRVQTNRNYSIQADKGTDHQVTNNQVVTLSYGSYVLVDEFGGDFQFSTGDVVSLRSSPANFLSTYSTGSVSGPGSEIGTARLRCVTWDSGVPGTPSAVYRIYLFDIQMGVGRNFRDVRSLYYAGTNPGVADVVLQLDPTTAANVAVLQDPGSSSLLFESGVRSLKNANNATYTYRTIDQSVTVSNTGTATISLASSPSEFFPYTGALTPDDMRDLTVVPRTHLRSNVSLGSVAVTTGSANLVGTGTSFIQDLRAGDYVYVSGSATQNLVASVSQIVNNTFLVLASNATFTNATSGIVRTFPLNVPVPFGNRIGLTASTDANSNILTLDFRQTFVGTGVNSCVTHNIERVSVSPSAISAARERFVRISLANNAGGTNGPWCVGLPGVTRCRGVWLGNSSSVSTSDMDVSADFVIDTNQTPAYLDLGWLVKTQNSTLSLANTDWLLVELDHATRGSGFFATPSWVSSNSSQVALVDSQPLSNLTTQFNSLEIPSVYASNGSRYDLTSVLDFRPSAANTVASSTNAASCPINPSSDVSFGNTADPDSDNKFPLPGTSIVLDVDRYLGRNDGVVMGKDGNVAVIRGVPSENPLKRYVPAKPQDSLLLDVVSVPPYPTIPMSPSRTVLEIIDTGTINEVSDQARNASRTASTTLTKSQISANQPVRFSMADAGSLTRRVQTLEYYSSLSTLETSVKNKTIPSSVDPGTDRFKFGFLVDDYDDESRLDTSNPQFSANVVGGELVPDVFSFPVCHVRAFAGYPPYVDWPAVDQENATDGPIKINYTPVSANSLPITDSPCTDVFDFAGTGSWTKAVNLPNVSGTVYLYYKINVSKLYLTDNPQAVTIDVYQGQTKIKSFSDATELDDGWESQVPLFMGGYGAGSSLKYVSGVISWTYDPSNGRSFLIDLGVGASSDWALEINYPIDCSKKVEPTPPSTPSQPATPTQPSPPPPVVTYTGTMTAFATVNLTGYNSVSPTSTFSGYTGNYAITVSVTGLKPSTAHTLSFDGKMPNVVGGNVPAGARITMTSGGGYLTTDATGSMSFVYTSPGQDFQAGGGFSLTVPIVLTASNSTARYNLSYSTSIAAAIPTASPGGTINGQPVSSSTGPVRVTGSHGESYTYFPTRDRIGH